MDEHNKTVTSENNPSNKTNIEPQKQDPNKSDEKKDGPRFLYINFTTADEATYESNRVIDFATFVSATGGNLGLFTGFSFMGLLFTLFGWIEYWYQRRVVVVT